MRKVMLAALSVASIGAAVSAASAGDALSPYEMNAFLQKDQAAHQGYHPQYYSQYEPGSTGSIGPAPGAMYGQPELWPPCMGGPPNCTAAGYPNLRYLREMNGGY